MHLVVIPVVAAALSLQVSATVYLHAALPAPIASGLSLGESGAARDADAEADADADARAVPIAPGARFAAAVLTRAAAGWTVRDARVEADAASMRVALVMSDGRAAQSLSLVFDAAGTAPIDFARAAAAVPEEVRRYGFEADLYRVLAAGGPLTLEPACTSFHLAGTGGGVALADDDYHVAVRARAGEDAGRLVADELASLLDDGYELVSVDDAAEAPAGADRGLELVLEGDAGRVIVLGTDPGGAVVSAEVRRTPVGHGWQAYTRGTALARALRAGGAVARISLQPHHGATDATFVMRGGRRYVVDGAHYEPGDFACPC